MQLKIKPDMIIEEMKKDKDFIRSTRRMMPEKLVNRNMRRKHTITEQDIDDILGRSYINNQFINCYLDSEFDDPEPQKRTHNKYKSIIEENNYNTPHHLRLDSRIDPRKSIILDISIIDKNLGNPSKSVKNKTSHKIYELKKVFQ